jgi:hypothetical protein
MFQVQAHIVKEAASASCSGRPLRNCSAHLEDNSNVSVDLATRDPSEPPFPFRSLTRLRRAEASSLAILALQNESTSREKTTTMEI